MQKMMPDCDQVQRPQSRQRLETMASVTVVRIFRLIHVDARPTCESRVWYELEQETKHININIYIYIYLFMLKFMTHHRFCVELLLRT